MYSKLKICLFTVSYKRLELTDYVLNFYNNIKKDISDICDLELVCIGSDGKKGKEIAEKNGFDYYEYTNEPVSQKHNYGAKICKRYNPDAVIYVGSDDIMTIDFFYYYIDLIKNGIDFCGIKDVYFLTKDLLGYWNGYKPNNIRYNEPIGPGKVYSKSLMEKLNWKPWGDKKINRGLDNLVTEKLNTIKDYKKKIISCNNVGGFFIDIKTKVNISNISEFTYDKEYDLEYINKLDINYDKIKDLLITK